MHPKVAIYAILLISLLGFSFGFGLAVFSSITNSQFLKDPEALISSNADFKLGFFSPANSTNRYLGIWYNNKNFDGELEVVWVANRDSPLKDSSGMLKISDGGNFQILDAQNKIHWSTNISYNVTSKVAKLLDTGNFVLLPDDGSNSTIIWQSFDHPTDSILPLLKVIFSDGMNDGNVQSWKSSNDPSKGHFQIGRLSRNLPEFSIVEDGDKLYWRSGPWNGNLFIGLPYPISGVFSGFIFVDEHNGTSEVSFEPVDHSLLHRFVLTYDGNLIQKTWNDSSRNWETVWQSWDSECDVYGKCGPFALCSPKESPICDCLKGFVPKNIDEWRKGNWTNGCVRRTPLQCDAPGGNSDKFWQMKQVKIPDNAQWIIESPDSCQSRCSRNCSCVAYSYYPGIGCILWNVSLIDMQQFSSEGVDVFVRLAHSELPEGGKWKVRVAVIVILSALVSGILMFFLWRWMRHRCGKKSKTKPNETDRDTIFGAQGSNSDCHDLPLFEFTTLVTATDHFSIINKLGQGGFGPVYKGVLEDGQHIAVKRLSRASGQGLREFMNELVVISKLQHKNLVRLLGCCVEGEEKLLVYELMPNKSLDAILFGPAHREILDWQKRFEIIQGVCRGLLYLHRDSRLRIIHRDLKPSNILLDEELNPKISDFGMARIFGSNQDQAKTPRVVGTYGYMSPEYAMEGRFSEKSDVFSLGVLLLEIVSGRRNNFVDEESLNLLAYAWKLWNTKDTLSLTDPTVYDPRFEEQILKCIQAGLLCVQEFPVDRPNVSSLIYMLEVDDAENLPHPKQPGFARSEVCSSGEIIPYDQEHCSLNDVSLTAVIGR